MKKHLTKKTFWQSLLSAIVLVIFVLLTTGTMDIMLEDFMKYDIKDKGNGVFEEIDYHASFIRITTGRRDRGRWQGPVEIEILSRYASDERYDYYEDVNMVNGLRDGESKITHYDSDDVAIVEVEKYSMGILIDKQLKNKGKFGSKADISAFQVLVNKYPWFNYSLNAMGYDSLYVKAYMDIFETKLNAYTFDVKEFDEYYGDVVDELEETPYDSIITLNSQLTMFQGMAAMKNAEFRLAVIDRYLLSATSTFNIISTTYPGYLLNLNILGVNNTDFKVFCQDMDSRMNSYGALNMQDPFFIDSLDTRMFRAILAISNAGKSSSLLAEQSLNSMLANYKGHDINDIYDEVIQILKPSISKSTPKEVSTIVVSDMLSKYYIPSEIIYMAVKEAYYIKKGIKRLATATTGFVGNNSATSVSLTGYIIEDGGAVVTSRGIAWATFYNPTINDNKAAQGTGTGSFPATLSGLTYGTTYYARTYATNSAGTSYGNCIIFNTNITTAINDIEPLFTQDFSIYPNPASSSVTLNFQLETSGKIQLIVIDMKGQIVLKREPGNLPKGENEIYLDVSALQNGLYTCILTNGVTKVMQKLLIAR